jgi:cephalosporin-C deacetylase
MQNDMPIEQLRSYRGKSAEPADFDAFWASTLDGTATAAGTRPMRLEPVDHPFAHLEIFDATFAGWAGQDVKAWLRLPAADAARPLPGIVFYQGYGGGRGFAFENLLWADAGYAVLSVDSRGQGAAWGPGDTPDDTSPVAPAGPQFPGFMTRGVRRPEDYYYRRLIADCVAGFDAMAALDQVDPTRVGVMGGSQGALLSLAVPALRPGGGTGRSGRPGVAAANLRVPFLCDPRRALEVTDELPYGELTQYLAVHRQDEAAVFNTLSYVDGVNFGRRATAPALVSVGLGDQIAPPSTVFAMYNNYAGPKQLDVWPFNGHEGGGFMDDLAALQFMAAQLGGRGFRAR